MKSSVGVYWAVKMLAGVYTHYIYYISSSGPGIGRHVVIPHYNLYIDEGLRIHIRKTEKIRRR